MLHLVMFLDITPGSFLTLFLPLTFRSNRNMYDVKRKKVEFRVGSPCREYSTGLQKRIKGAANCRTAFHMLLCHTLYE